jgi:hypothetical protein
LVTDADIIIFSNTFVVLYVTAIMEKMTGCIMIYDLDESSKLLYNPIYCFATISSV